MARHSYERAPLRADSTGVAPEAASRPAGSVDPADDGVVHLIQGLRPRPGGAPHPERSSGEEQGARLVDGSARPAQTREFPAVPARSGARSHRHPQHGARAEGPGRNRPRARRERRSTRGRRAHGFLAYAMGLVLVLSAVYGVASTVSGAGDVATDNASSRWHLDGRPAWKDAGAWFWSWGKQRSAQAAAARAASPTAGAVPPATAPTPADEDDAQAAAAVPSPASGNGAAAVPSPASGNGTDEETGAATAQAAGAGVATGPSLPAGTWLSGASGVGVADGNFAAWRGSPVEIIGVWADDDVDNQTNLYALQSGEPGDWAGPVDIGIGAIFDGESWAAAADGAYDERWRESLTQMAELRAGKGTTYIRFAHEMNGTWFPWSVAADEAGDFIDSWQRFRALQQELFPAAQLVFCVNRDSSDNDLDWREIFPGAEHVDVMGVDYYNQWPYVETREEWEESLVDTDGYGAPRGLQAHLDFARSVGLPLSVGEWSGNADEGDSVAFIEGMHEFFTANAGSGPGQLLYEVQFNVDIDGRRWLLHGDTRMPASAAAYRALW